MNKIHQKLKQKGLALLYAVVVGSIILLVGLSIIALTVSELRSAERIDDAARAFYAGESGAEWAARQLTNGGTLMSPIACNSPSTALASPPTNPDGDPDKFSWTNLKVFVIITTDSKYLRAQAEGSSYGAKRTVNIDFKPYCDFSSSVPGYYPGNDVGIHPIYP